jgi:hypothetical protein
MLGNRENLPEAKSSDHKDGVFGKAIVLDSQLGYEKSSA